VLAGLRGVLAASVHFIIKCEKGANFGCNIPMLRSDRAYIYSPDARLSCRKLSTSRRGGTDVRRIQGFTWFSFAHPLFNIALIFYLSLNIRASSVRKRKKKTKMVSASASTYASILGKVAKATAQDASQVLAFYAASVAPKCHRKHRALHHDSKFC
jgi:hypothetical protein